MPATCCPAPDPVDYSHRSPDSPYADERLCFNGRPKASHICVTECAKPGRLCLNCRRLTDLSGQEIRS